MRRYEIANKEAVDSLERNKVDKIPGKVLSEHDFNSFYKQKIDGFESYVDGKVKTDVPVNAKFTDTNTVTSINGKTGAISKADIVALGIPAQDTVVDISGKVDKDIVGEANGIAPLDSEGKVPSVFLNHLVFSIEKPTNGAVLWFEEIV